ncbi:hypothetical protein BGW36DRAFT_361922 [Talaromyces proteolyticus]|uniref:Uncharacterized protein n=1 Tax=Talaromyces proteolyticus TaxID=1131652 RepID=A0AAD4KLR1_9EURO|nr:uncharacterized protein BGW36DRAFT_361922 [Talaromyces proteolyticus]KAH8694099.1 hypothetical protein BGW36DRAFT_361922 [Talaromyces proteolyticus]
MSAYSFRKLINLQISPCVAAETPNVVSISLHPGVVDTEMTIDSFERCALDTPEPVAGVGVWLCTEKARFLNGRFVNSNWDVDDLYERREEIQGGKFLQVDLMGPFVPSNLRNNYLNA